MVIDKKGVAKVFNKNNNKLLLWRWISLLAFIVMLVVNGLAGSTNILGGVNTAVISDSYPNLFAPAGITFLIWGVIYALLTGFMVNVFINPNRKKSKLSKTKLIELLYVFTITSVLNTTWLLAWQYKVLWLSMILMIGLLIGLMRIIDIIKSEEFKLFDWLTIRLPFSVYFGWISVALIANITTWLVSINWDGFGYSDGTWMVAVLIVGAVIGIVNSLRLNDVAYLTVFIWAYSGILLKHLSPEAFDGKYPSVIITLTIVLAVFISTVVQLTKKYIK